ncbi:MAG TPA: DUF2207 domain-containing protein, partial [Chitinophagaceae bacterium]|nr:DUF2207 domain-containing protein [Chitinophagaceae bacterium]
MRNNFLILVFLSSVFFASAQKTEPQTWFFTQPSEKYFTDAEIDSLLHSTTETLFKENMVPEVLFDKNYPVVKSLLMVTAKNNIVVSFKAIENKLKKNIVAENGSQQYADNKKLYTEALLKQVRNAFYTNKFLLPYISFNTSDRITYFNSTVRVGNDGKLLVQEKITVNNGNGGYHPVYGADSALQNTGVLNDEIKRGIVRAFPLYYINKYKLFQNTTFKLKEVLRDGKKENYHTKKHENGILVYTGSSSVFLDKGTYTYTITYETDNQLKLLKKFDELYWNVTGNGWSFRIDSAMCTVILPKGAAPLSNKCYTGSQGDTNEDCSITTQTLGDSTIIVFKTTRPLSPKQGITIATSWPKGIVKGQSGWRWLKNYIWNNKAVFFLPIAAFFSAILCFIFWLRYGRDPKKGSVYPQFEPPADYSPAVLGYIYYQEFTRQLTAATIVDAAVRNIIKIDVEREGKVFKHNEYNIRKADGQVKPPVSNYQDFESDITDLIGTTIEKGKYNKDLKDLNKSVESYCISNYKGKDGLAKKKGFFKLNNSYTTIPVLICFAAGVWSFFGGVVTAMRLKNFWHIGYFVVGIIICTQVIKIFTKLLAAYSPAGRKLMDKIEGFRMFLSTADEHRFDTMSPPKKSLELYEKYLPFAIALGCEIEWGQKFEEIINTAYLGAGTAMSSFSNSLRRNNESFSSSFASSFSGAISSASSP